MESDGANFKARLERLEQSVRRTRIFAAVTVIGLLAIWLTALAPRQASDVKDVIRTKVLVIEDSEGRERIVLGAPMPDARGYTGMKILNPDGAEQFAVSLKPNGSVGMGFDTQPGVGDPRNRERLNLGVTSTGQGWIRYLDNQTRVRMWAMLDSNDRPVIQFLDWPGDERIVVRQLGFSGDEVFEWER